MPHGPAKAVFVAEPCHIQAPISVGGAGSFISCGWPPRKRFMSGSGPRRPIVIGGWQSLHAEMVRRYLPRWTGLGSAGVGPDPAPATTTTPITAAHATAASGV